MNVIIAATKSCHHRPILSRELTQWGYDFRVKYFEDHPDLMDKYGYQKSPLVIVNDEVVSVGMPDLIQLKNILVETEKRQRLGLVSTKAQAVYKTEVESEGKTMWDWSHMNGWGGQMMGGGFGMILWLVVLVAIIWLIVRMTQRNSEQSGPRQILPKEESALEVLKKRYARGEITREQYQQMKEDLDSN